LVLLTKYVVGDQIKNNEMGGTCSMYGGEIHTGFWWEKLGGTENFEDPGIDGRIILRWIFRKWDLRGDMDFIVLV